MDRRVAAESGLEVELARGPEILTQPYAEKYPTPTTNSEPTTTSQPYSSSSHNIDDTSIPSHRNRKRQGGFNKKVWILAMMVGFILCLAVAVGAGLGAGLAAQRHKSSDCSSSR